MTNREWLNSLTDKEFVEWLFNESSWDWEKMKSREISPTFREVHSANISSRGATEYWLKQERCKDDKTKDN